MDISDSPAKGHSFGKIVLCEISCHDKLTIPREFIRKYGKYLRARIYLKAPRGGVWPVDLVGYSDEVWLQNGWPEFAQFYTLCFGHFLVFKYQGNSYFDVFVYDKSGIEIDYPVVNTVINTDEEDNLNTEQSTQVEERVMSEIDESKACKKRRANSACIKACDTGDCLMQKLQHQKIAKVISNQALEATWYDNIRPLDMSKPTKVELNLHDPLHQDKLNEGGASSYAGNSTTLASAKAYKSNIPSFVLTVAPSYLSVKSRVDIKKAFAVKYMRSTQNFEVCLQVKERTWSVTCTVFRNRYRFCKGWSKFAEGNSLSVGDVCVFQLINEAPMLLKVFSRMLAR